MSPGLILMGASTVMSAVGAYQQGQAAERAGEYNARIAALNAIAARQQAAFDAAQQDRQNRLLFGSIKAAQGASGGTADSSSVMAVLADAAAQGELAKRQILYQGELKAQGATNTGQLELMKGKAAAKAGKLGAVSDLLGGASKMYTMART